MLRLTTCQSNRDRGTGKISRIWLRNKPVDHISGNVREPEITALKAVSQFGVVDPHLMKNCCVQIVHVHGVLCDVVAQLISLSERYAWLETASCYPHREGSGMMIAPQELRMAAGLVHRRAP